MAPYFETIKSFAEVPVTAGGIDTQAFIDASDGLVQMFDLFASGVFGFIQSDLRSNIDGVRSQYQAARASSGTLEELVRNEGREVLKHATPCLVRLTRYPNLPVTSSALYDPIVYAFHWESHEGLLLTYHALSNMQSNTSAELHVCFKQSYDKVLRHHHSFLVRSLVSMAIRSVPRRADFYKRLAQGGSVEKLDMELARWLVGLIAIVNRVSGFLADGGYGQV